MPSLVSVIIPCYNRTEQLRVALESVRAQTYPYYELIVVDDGTDDGIDIPPLLWGARRSRLIRLDINWGVSKARNTGASAAQGPLLAFLDSDDRWHKEKLEKQVAWLRDNPSYRIVQSREIWIRKGVRVNPPRTHVKKQGDIFAQSLERCMVTPSSVMLQKSLFDEVGGFNESLPACEDYDLWLRITSRHPVGLIDEELLTRYGGHNDQLSSTVFALDRFRIRALLNLLANERLTDKQRQLVNRCLTKKATILANGYKKRGKVALHERYRKIADRFVG